MIQRSNSEDVEQVLNELKQQGIDKQVEIECMYHIGRKYHFSQNYGEAAEWYRKAAEQGHVRAQHYLGILYEEGKGVEQDYTKALQWYTKSAEQGDEDAELKLIRLEDSLAPLQEE